MYCNRTKKEFVIGIVSLVFCVACSSEHNFEKDYKVYEVQGNVRQIVYKNVENNANDMVITYNKDGMLLSEQIRGQYVEYQYDGLYVHSLKLFTGDSLELKRRYTYSKNLPVEIREYDAKGTFRKRVSYSYDEKGNRTQGLILTPYNDTLYTWHYVFEDDKVQQETRINYMQENRYQQRFLYEYNKNGMLTSISEYDDDSVLMTKTEYENFHGVDLQTKVIHYWNGQPSDTIAISYGFDDKGNWVFKRTKYSTRRENRQERTILYYK